MTDRVVVCFRATDLFVEPATFLAEARAITEQAAARGGRLVAWGAAVTAFELDPESIQDVVELALSVIRDAPDGREPSVGISEGPLERIEEATVRIELAWGLPLIRAATLARAGRPGEVLLDPEMPSVKRGDLVTAGSRIGIHGRERVRGLLLDVGHPFRTALATGARGVARSPLIGRPELDGLDLPGGAVAVVRADRGHGGSRFLEELEQRLEPARVLEVSPHPFGEPLGALRRAFLRAVTRGQAPLNLTGHAGEGLDALLGGEGLDPDSSAELLAMWLTPDSVQDARGAVLLDDAGEIDADTLEVIARAAALAGEPFRVVARIGQSDPVPAALAALPRASEIRLGPLTPEDASRLAVACTRGELELGSAARWADRGSRLPLGIVETIRGSIESGEIVWEDGHAIARQKAAGTEASGTPKHWVKRRLAEQPGHARVVLEALAVLGGQAESQDFTDLARRKAGAKFDPSAGLALLQAASWVIRLKPDVMALPSATHRDAVLATLTDSDFQAWHRAASESFQARERPLALGAATVHAILAGDMERGLELGRRAAAAIRAVGLEVTAAAFERFAEHSDVAALASRNLFTAQLEMARAAPSVWPEARASVRPPLVEKPSPGGGLITVPSSTVEVSVADAPRRSIPPPKPSWSKRPAPPGAPPKPTVSPKAAPSPASASASAATGTSASVSAEPMAGRPPETAPSPSAPSVPTPASPEVAATRAPAPVLSVRAPSMRAPSGDGAASAAVDAFRKGDLEAVERMATQVGVDEGRTGLAERLQAMAKLARGETGDAIRRLRDAAGEARRTNSKDRCRAALALAVALGAASRHEEALLEALDALARARELKDERGEHACRRFLSQLAATAGHHDVAEAWVADTAT